MRLWNRNFVLVWQGQMVSQIGSQAFVIATMFWIKHATESASLMGLVMMLGTLPYVLLGSLGGVLADRASRRRIVVTCDVAAGIGVLALALAMATVPHATAFLIICVCAASALLGAVGAFFHPAIIAMTPALVPPERLAAANSLREASGDMAALAGQALGGIAFRLLGAPLLFLIDGASYLFAAGSTSLARIEQAPASSDPASNPGMRAALREGFTYIRGQRGLTSLVVMATSANFFGAPFIVVLPFYVEGTLGVTSDWFGYLIASAGAGGLLGYLVAGAVPRARGAAVLLSCLGAMSVSILALARAAEPLAAAVLMGAMGLTAAVFNVGVITLIQKRTPDTVRGRVFGLVQTLAMAATPLAMLLAGALADATGRDARVVFAVCGAALMMVTLAAAAHAPLRAYLNDRPSESNN